MYRHLGWPAGLVAAVQISLLAESSKESSGRALLLLLLLLFPVVDMNARGMFSTGYWQEDSLLGLMYSVELDSWFLWSPPPSRAVLK